MNALIMYDSAYGNTAKVAQAIEDALSSRGPVKMKRISESQEEDLTGVDLLIVGSPTQGGRPTQPTQEFIGHLPSLNGLKVAAFDTRLSIAKQGFALKLLIKTIGFAAEKIARALKAKGGLIAKDPGAFVVTGKEGPLADGELERVAVWAHHLAVGAQS